MTMWMTMTWTTESRNVNVYYLQQDEGVSSATIPTNRKSQYSKYQVYLMLPLPERLEKKRIKNHPSIATEKGRARI